MAAAARPWTRHPAVIAALLVAAAAVWGRVAWQALAGDEDDAIAPVALPAGRGPVAEPVPWPDGLRDPFTGRSEGPARPAAASNAPAARRPSTPQPRADAPDPFPYTLRGIVGETALLAGSGAEHVVRAGDLFEGPAGAVHVVRVQPDAVVLRSEGQTRRLALE